MMHRHGGAGFSLSRKSIEDTIVPYESVPKLMYLWDAYCLGVYGGTQQLSKEDMIYINMLWKLYVTLCKKIFESPKKVAKIVVKIFVNAKDGRGNSKEIIEALD